MRIAVLMSIYNGHKYLNAQLLSLAEQTVKNNMTVYIRDDGSEDNTFEIIDLWKEKINIVLYKGCNVGPAMSFWELFMNQEIQADYYAFCDQDDIWDSDKIELGIKHLTGSAHFYACNCRIIDENGNIVKSAREKSAPEISIPRLFVSGCTQGCSMVFTDALRKYIMNLKIHCIPMHDVILMLYAIQFGKIFWDQEPHFSYRVHSNNVVAKENKSIVQKLKTTYWNWNNSSKHSMANVAKEMCNNINDLSLEDKLFLNRVLNYKMHRIRLIRNCKSYRVEHNALRSFKVRVLLGLY